MGGKSIHRRLLPAHTAPTTLLALPVDDLEPVDKGWHMARYLQHNRYLVRENHFTFDVCPNSMW